MLLLAFLTVPLFWQLAIAYPESGRLSKRAIPSPWTYQGCISDAVNQRTLTAATYVDDNGMTNEECVSYCSSQGFSYAGTEYYHECYCGDSLTPGWQPEAATDCNTPCAGDGTESCGGPNRLSLYWTGAAPPAPNPGVAGWSLLGCYTDAAERTLTVGVGVPGGGANMSILNCVNACSTAGFTYAGTEYSGECYCDNNIQNGGGPAPDGFSGCSMLCNGNSSEYCGGSWHLEMYQFKPLGSGGASTGVSSTTTTTTLASSTTTATTTTSPSTTTTTTTTNPSTTTTTTTTTTSSPSTTTTSTTTTTGTSTTAQTSPSAIPGWALLGCYTDSVSARTLRTGMGVIGGPSNMTLENCQVACKAEGFIYAGSEYSGECWCDNQLMNGGGPAPDGNAQCNMLCNGNQTEICGGPDRLTLFKWTDPGSASSLASTATSPTSTTTPSSTTTITTTTATSPTSMPTSSPTSGTSVSSWTYQGCYTDNYQNYGRSMTNEQPDNTEMTIESCIQTCAGLGYSVAGMEYYRQCFCDNYVRNGAPIAPTTDCNTPCDGNSAEMCGGPNRLTIYTNTTTLTVLQPPTQQLTAMGGNWAYYGCLTDNLNNKRLLPNQVILPNNNTAETCLELCAKYGYPVGGLEYSQECYCGDPGDIGNATPATESDCHWSICSGNQTQYCGGPNRLATYTWQAAPMYVFDYPTGTAAGEYQFLIGGVVVPLITIHGVNGKVTFVEKLGTGAPNSTGSYELDLAEINNFTAAWRPMHPKTDVFCAAGLQLPDKAGRQLVVGGWSSPSTYGVRSYTPDGSPGLPGVNDWQESPQTQLQDGRWYPSAMIMANGTILVVGGENGSNGPPVPTLEILPRSGPTLYMDWLNRTDPLNLYPFMVQLPSGRLFAGYWHEARILDQNTFDTIQTLPDMPGAVGNDINTGRTYPLEGTMVLLPQIEPYTDPLTVLICGGSTNPSGGALDSCVSIQPEVPGQNWTYERMPSKRVMSCMTPLPDGTFLIMNGAQQGVAGFGLANTPNFNALLYDPTKPAGHRISVMANTTVARLYHSEAITLLDGRVLVSGSDPQDPDFPEEYRVEVFMPPYLLSGLPQPSFTITNTDWAYGDQISFQLTSGSTANLRVSLLGADASTHGNIMGQRTFFPTVSCTGTTCTFNVPPNANICPPGWFKMYVLDGPTPSIGVFVRVGKDPANLGLWPANDPAFAPLPGI